MNEELEKLMNQVAVKSEQIDIMKIKEVLIMTDVLSTLHQSQSDLLDAQLRLSEDQIAKLTGEPSADTPNEINILI